MRNLDLCFGRRLESRQTNQIFAVLVAVFVIVFNPNQVAATPYPLQASGNGRYLVDATGQPFLLTADSAWSYLVNLNTADTAMFLHARATNGFNAVLGSLVCVQYTGGRADASMLDGTVPFTNSINGQFDLASVNPAYFLEVSNLVQIVNTNGMIAILDPLETGGFLNCALANGPAKCLAYGQYIGNFFKSFTNIIWLNGNDYASDDPNQAAHNAVVTNVAWGIHLTAPNQPQTIEQSPLESPGNGMNDPAWWYDISFAGAYSWSPQYFYIAQEYAMTNAIPVVLMEAHYENESVGFPPSYNNTEDGTPLVLRHQEWWTMLAGGCGQFYGNNYTWTFISGWQGQLVTEATTELNYWEDFLNGIPWWNLVPDTNQTVVTTGYGTYSGTGLTSTNDYVTTAWNPDGTLVVAYLPNRNNITVDMAKLAGACAALWFDPTSGNYRSVNGSPFPNTGMQTFTPPGNNAAGDPDWVLLLDTNPPSTPVLPTFIQQNYAVPQAPQAQVSVGYPAAQVAGDANILAIGWFDTNASISAVSDSAGNVYQAAVSTFRSNSMSQAIYYATNISGGINTVTVTFDQAANYVDLRAAEYSGLGQADIFDTGSSASGVGTSADSGSVTTASTNELIFGAGLTWDVFAAPGAGFANGVITVPNADIIEDMIAAVPGTYNATATVGSSYPWLMQLAAFKPLVAPLTVLLPTTVALASDSNPSAYGKPVTFTATVETNGEALGGIGGETITFYNGAAQLGAGTLNSSGQASYTTTVTQLPAGMPSITAVYAGDAVYAASTNSPALFQAVSQATLTAGLTGTVSKNYDGTVAAIPAAGNYTLSGEFTGDSVTLNNPTSGTYDTSNQGIGKTVTVTGLAISGASATNYTLSSASIFGAVGTINKTNVAVTAAANGKQYDGTTNAAAVPAVTSGSVQTGDSANFTESYDTKNAGVGKILTPSGSVNDGNGGNNYSYTFVAAANGTITAGTLIYTAAPAVMTYGAVVPGLSGSVGGFVGSDNQGNATSGTLSFTTTATASSGVGSYAVNGSGLTANSGNYTFAQAAGNVTALAINALPVNVTGTRSYDGTLAAPAGILAVANNMGSDNVTVAAGSGSLAGAGVGVEVISSFGTLTLGGSAAGNYTLTGASGSVTITPAGLAVTNLLVEDKVYDGSTNATLDATQAGLEGVLAGDPVTWVTSNAVACFADRNVGTNKPVTVAGLALGGEAATNYSVLDPTNLTAGITPAGLTAGGVTVASKVYDGTTNAQLSGSATLNGLVSGDDVSLVTNNVKAAFADPNVGTNKPVTVSGYAITGADAGNYTLAQPFELTANILPLVAPVFGIPAISGGTKGWQLHFSAQAGQTYKVLVTDELKLPWDQWTVLTNGTFGAGTITVRDTATNLPVRFYLIVSP